MGWTMFSLQELLKKIEEAIQDPEGLSEDDGFHILQGKDYPNAVKRFVVGLVYALKDHVIDSDEVTYLEIWRKKFSPDEPIDYEHLNLIRREYLLKHLTKKHIPDANKINALVEISDQRFPFFLEDYKMALKKVVETANEESNSAIMSYAQTALRNFEKFFKENQNQSRH